jgi:CheY-like chemotaxis protein
MKTPCVTNPNILLIDDNHDGLLVRRALLEEAGCHVSIARTPDEGLKLFKSAVFDVVVTDYRMPCMNGAEVIRGVRKVNPGARVILLSGFVDGLGLTEENTGADVVLSKTSNEAVHLVRWVKRLAQPTSHRKPPASQKSKSPSSRATSV